MTDSLTMEVYFDRVDNQPSELARAGAELN